jgi:hypothetical protein
MNYAQTNLQLLNQLAVAGYDGPDCVLVASAYRLAMRLYSAWYRPSGKTFIAHVVGTASVLVSLRTSATSIAAGLLHAAYTHGEFAAGEEPADAARTLLTATVGADVERLVTMYWELQWNPETVERLATPESVIALRPLERELLLVRLANELEDHLDLAALYGLGPNAGRSYAEAFLPPALRLAELLGEPALASELGRVLGETRSAYVGCVFGSQKASAFLPPQTHCLKFKLAVAERMGRIKAGRAALRAYRRIRRSANAVRGHAARYVERGRACGTGDGIALPSGKPRV